MNEKIADRLKADAGSANRSNADVAVGATPLASIDAEDWIALVKAIHVKIKALPAQPESIAKNDTSLIN